MNAPQDYFKYLKGEIYCEGVAISKIVKSVGTPVYVYSQKAFVDRFISLKKALKPLNPLICFAVKSNSNLAILSLLGRQGAGMDIVSGGELLRARKAGVPASKIIFSGVGKSHDEITQALKVGVHAFNCESAQEVARIATIATQLKRKAKIGLRFNPDIDAKTHPFISTGKEENKFGLQKSEIESVFKEFANHPGLEISGLSIHIGSQILDLSPLRESFQKLIALREWVHQNTPAKILHLDIGGGLGIQYQSESPIEVDAYAKSVVEAFLPLKNADRRFKLSLEPGRFIAGNAGILVSRIEYRKTRAARDFLVIDAGMNDLLRPALYEARHRLVPLLASQNEGTTRPTDIVGPVCESSDCFESRAQISPALDAGDYVALLSAGAYGFSMASNYNSRPRPAEVLIHKKSYRVIRKRETLADLIRGEKR